MKEGHGHPYQWCVPVLLVEIVRFQYASKSGLWSKINRKLMCQVKFIEINFNGTTFHNHFYVKTIDHDVAPFFMHNNLSTTRV